MKNSSSKQVQRKWADVQEKSCSPKSTAKNELKVPKKTYTKLYRIHLLQSKTISGHLEHRCIVQGVSDVLF